MANLYYYEDSSCSTQLSHSAVSITGTILTAAALISYPGTAPEGQELDYWMISGKLAGLSDIKAEENLDVTNYIVSNSLMLYPVWRTIITFTPSAISAVPLGNTVAPQGAVVRYGNNYSYDSTSKSWILDNLLQQNYDIVITTQDTDETFAASQVNFENGDTVFTAKNVQDLGAELITGIKELQTSNNNKVSKTGDTMTGDLTLSESNITVNTGIIKVTDPIDLGYVEIQKDRIVMSDISNGTSYNMQYLVDDSSGQYAITYANSLGNPVYIVGVADPVDNYGVANKQYVSSAIGAATADIKTYIDTAITEKIADAIGGTY